ncbi:MAG: ligase-associated DNA damage response endonuclease PdeM [Sphingomonadales bacterium]|nr:ligase-associated DNA damage response endonuclease PdeM [Sphingomonadales bacterium]PIX66884.1 MAG: phosphoesterase [Sphingomonadales bacterium CG_4_10_14_3_um_filter_58_15]NCO48213.1 ligase-associated DNA damage response endonuclease PdeM [Sphingomonadales bacterium]NCO99758.1 ligase-associated DNA damage response endonuclease PdeM [Sphingomonadales bacterium]NCP27441.1 ligase-associated DNA damage response endonuclease PdeM [Sphingomonadales bacterium]
MVPLLFTHHRFAIVAPAALYWPAKDALLVADLHLEKASFYARQGQMLPPYDSQATLQELANLVRATGATTVFCLGDNYHDGGGEARLEPGAAKLLTSMTADLDWVWITGNHDRDVAGLWGGSVVDEWTGEGLALRHEATASNALPEISGHYHPKLRIAVRGRHVSRRCFVRGQHHLILPAFGSLTGGMAAQDPVIEACVGGPAEAIIGLKDKPVRFPLPFADRSIDKIDDPQLALPLVTSGQ